jgi:hypothetical protein
MDANQTYGICTEKSRRNVERRMWNKFVDKYKIFNVSSVPEHVQKCAISLFHGENTGSIPVGRTSYLFI